MEGPDDSFLDRSLREFAGDVATEELLPGAGTVAAYSAALAAGLVSMAARRAAREIEDALDVAEEADSLRERLLLLAVANADAYREASASLGRDTEDDGSGRDGRLGSDLARAAYTPLSIAEVAKEVAELAAIVAEGSDPDVRPDAAAAACLAESAVRTGAHLVKVNLGVLTGDDRIDRAELHVTAAAAARERALAPAR